MQYPTQNQVCTRLVSHLSKEGRQVCPSRYPLLSEADWLKLLLLYRYRYCYELWYK
jgi:hypothetical protein